MSRITKKVVRRLVANGINATTRIGTIRKTFASEFADSDSLTREEVAEIREALTPQVETPASTGTPRAQKEEAPARSPEELLSDAQKFVRARVRAVGSYWKNVKEIVETTSKGRPARVVVRCSDPQKVADGSSVCEKTREIAIQDLFQVVRCSACQRRSVQIYRNGLARRRRSELATRRQSA